ncbi:MAG TPA: hypothetical protein VHN37_00700, partial [Actinomycetota bacterium]|nr:hypothetical protein [Actinomycetota bacterium]
MRDLEDDLRRLRQEIADTAKVSTETVRRAVAGARRRRVATLFAAAGGAIVLVSTGTLAAQAVLDERVVPAPPAAADASPDRANVMSTVDLEGAVGITSSSGDVWITTWSDGCESALWRVEGAQPDHVATFPFAADELVWGFGSIWIEGMECPEGGELGKGVLYRVDPTTGARLAVITTPYPELFGLAADSNAVWVGTSKDLSEGRVLRVDPVANELLAEVPIDGRVMAVYTGEGSVWALVAGGSESGVVRIDPTTNEVMARVAPRAWGAAVGGGYLWAPTEATLGGMKVAALRIDASTGKQVGDPIPLGDTTFLPVAADDTGVWFFAGRDGATLAHLSGESEEVDQKVDLGASHALTGTFDVESGVIWALDENAGRIT